MEALLFGVYLALGYWAVGVVFFDGKIVIHTFGSLFLKKLSLGFILGLVIIPLAIIKRIIFKR